MGLVRNKQGIVFTVLAIIIAVFFTLIFSARVEKPVDYKTTLIESRISVLNNYMSNFFEYAKSTASISGYSALQGIINKEVLNDMRASGAEFETWYNYSILTGNLTSSRMCPGMTNKTLTYYLDRIRSAAEQELNINSDYRINRINTYTNQTLGAFSIGLIINLSLNITDAYANLSDTRVITSIVSIEGLLDPLYLLNGTYNQTIKKTSINKGILGIWNSSDLQQLYYNHEYRNYRHGISFINRIKSNFTPNDLGIESFVNHTAPGVKGVYTPNQSMVDYLYWQNIMLECTSPSNRVGVVEINSSIISPPGFQLDEEHRNNFNISSKDTILTCP